MILPRCCKREAEIKIVPSGKQLFEQTVQIFLTRLGIREKYPLFTNLKIRDYLLPIV